MNILKHSFSDNFIGLRTNHKLNKLVKQRTELLASGEEKTGQIARLNVDIKALEESLRQPDKRDLSSDLEEASVNAA